MSSPINEWQAKKEQVSKSHKKLVNRLAKINDTRLHTLSSGMHDEIFTRIDCLECANCCKSIPPIVNETDIRRISKSLGMKVTDFKDLYLKLDEDMDMVINSSPCPFLQAENKCEIYENRPKACREYPHTQDFDFSKHLKLHAINSKYCPAVYHILEDLSKKI